MRKTGIDVIGSVPWGTHFCQFYQDKQDLIDILVPYFAAGLAQNEFCMWITSEPLEVADAKTALAQAVGNLDDYFRTGQLEILDYRDWYTLGGKFDSDRVLQGWVDKLAAAQQKGFAGLRLTGNTFWLEQTDWQDFTDYEAAIDGCLAQYQMMAMCTYSLTKCGAVEIMDVVRNHAFALIKRAGKWQIIESAERKRAEDALRESEARYRNLFTNMPDGFAYCQMLFDDHGQPEDWIYLAVNDAFGNLTGLKDVVGERATVAIHGIKDAHPELFDIYGRVAATGQAERFETYFVPLALWLDVSVFGAGNDHFVAVFSNISKRKQAEAALQESEHRERERAQELATLLDAVPTPVIIVHDPEGTHMTGNRAADELLRRPRGAEISLSAPAEARPQHFRAMKDGRELRTDEMPAQRAASGVLVRDFEFNLVFDDGTIRHLLGYGTPLRDETGQPRGAVHVLVDITERKQAEEALRESEERFRTMADGSPVIMWVTDTEGGAQFVNRTYREFFGVEYKQVAGGNWQPLVHPDDAPQYVGKFLQSCRDHTAFEAEARVQRADGEWRWIESHAEPRFSSSGEFLGHIGISMDITERKQAEEALLNAERARAELAETVALEINHRMKNNLMLISALLQLQATALPEDSDGAGLLQDALSRISALSVVHEQMYQMQSERPDLHYVLHRIAQVASNALASKDVELICLGAPIRVNSRVGSWLAIIANELVTNAVKYGAPGADGKLHLEMSLHRQEDNFKMSIWNSGNAVPVDFDPAKQRGLGLQIALQLVETQMKGVLTIQPYNGGTLSEVVVSAELLQ